MKIFYGVQGTGNGHIVRSRLMAQELYAAGFDVTFMFSGRPPQQYFDMDIFKDYRCCRGLTFHVNKGEVSYVKTALQNKPINFIREVKALDFGGFDLIISDFEPVTSWAARFQKRKVLGIGHQYAFHHHIPKAGSDLVSEHLMTYFAPADTGIGLHWHHFGQPIWPPIIETPAFPENIIKNKIVVYLPFEQPRDVIRLLSPYREYEFHLFSPVTVESPFEHIRFHPLSREGFKKAVYDCAGIITNAGFETPSESLQLGKKILVKPLHSQMEQMSNAAALHDLGYGRVMSDLNRFQIEHWLQEDSAVQISYPNTARLVVEWIQNGMPDFDNKYIEDIWSKVKIRKLGH
ncbi:MAG: MJ1255/VC2487 family glycosyltransferase [Gammaproteobacteria bacterium]